MKKAAIAFALLIATAYAQPPYVRTLAHWHYAPGHNSNWQTVLHLDKGDQLILVASCPHIDDPCLDLLATQFVWSESFRLPFNMKMEQNQTAVSVPWGHRGTFVVNVLAMDQQEEVDVKILDVSQHQEGK
jgi:hypothetical protein